MNRVYEFTRTDDGRAYTVTVIKSDGGHCLWCSTIGIAIPCVMVAWSFYSIGSKTDTSGNSKPPLRGRFFAQVVPNLPSDCSHPGGMPSY